MDQDLEISRFCIQFGEEPDPEHCGKLNLSLDFSQKLTKDSIDKLTTSSKGQLDINKACVLEIMTSSPENAQELLALIQELTSCKTDDNREENYGKGGVKTFNFIQLILGKGMIIIKSCIHSTDSRRVMVSIQGSNQIMSSIMEPLETLLDSGLSNVSDNTGNSIEFNILFSKFEQIANNLLKSSNIVSSVLQKTKLEGIIKLSKQLSDILSKVFDKIDPDFNQSPPMMFTKYFKMVDVDLRFNSADELPEDIKQKLFNPFRSIKFSEEKKVNLGKNKVFQKLIDLIASQIIVHINLMNFITLKLNIELPGITNFLEILFGGIPIFKKFEQAYN